MASSIGLCVLPLIGVNIFLQAYALATIEILFFIVCVYTYIKTKSNKLKGWQVYILPYAFLLIVIYGSFLKGLNEGLFLWSYIVPTLFYLLYGIKLGFITSALNLAVQTLILISKENTELYNITVISINFSLAYLVVWVVSHVYEKNREQAELTLKQLALKDPLTGAFNRLALTNLFNSEISDNSDVGVAIVDIDLFKKINDQYGHDAGDKVLTEFVSVLGIFLDDDQYFRIGGEEFVVIIFNDKNGLTCTLETIREHIENYKIEHNGKIIQFTFSAGISQGSGRVKLPNLLKEADQKLYQAKSKGRNVIL